MDKPGSTFIRSLIPQRGNFAAHVLTLFSGTSLAQLLVIVTAPVLTRLYTPEDFGILALFVSLSGIVGGVVCGRYEVAIVLPREEEDAANLLVLALVVATGLSLLALGVVAAFGQSLARLLHRPSFSFWLWFLPASYILAGLYNSLNYWNTRKKNFFRLSATRVSQSCGTVGTQMGVGLTALTGAGGLIAGDLVGRVVGAGLLGLALLREDYKVIRQSLDSRRMQRLGKEYYQFPVYDAWGVLANAGAQLLPFLLLNHFFDSFIVGSYYLAYRVINWPLNLINKSLSQVFYQKYEEKRKEGGKLQFLWQIIKILATLALIPAIALFVAAPYLFQVIFGTKWVTAGYFVRILTPFLYIRFIAGPLAAVFWSEGRTPWLFLLQLLLLFSTMIAFLGGGVLGSVNLTLVLYSGLSFVVYIIAILVAWKFAGYHSPETDPQLSGE